MVECKEFKALLSFLEPGYTLLSRKHVRDIIQYKHDLRIKQLREKLSKEDVSVALTIDIWTSSAQRHTLLSLPTISLLTGRYVFMYWSRKPSQKAIQGKLFQIILSKLLETLELRTRCLRQYMTRMQIWSCVFESCMMRNVGKVPIAFNYALKLAFPELL